jgi:hypothetical protein
MSGKKKENKEEWIEIPLPSSGANESEEDNDEGNKSEEE